MSGVVLHTAFDVLAWLAAGLAGLWLTRVERIVFPAASTDRRYIAAVLFGAGVGAYVFGTGNMWLSGVAGLGRSVEGAVAGGIVAVELYKHFAGIRTRTGARFALPFCVGVAIGRIGCYFAGVDDFTYGTPTTLPWGHDFGDSVLRHPVQLYEGAAMAAFALFYAAAVRLRDPFVIENGFYLAVAFYAIQRFAWEFIKPYGAVIGPFNLFHLLSLALLAYASFMILSAPQRDPAHDRAVA
jgi:phosphatidylglycerol---prolipoprotein diacylglyceryl transferase